LNNQISLLNTKKTTFKSSADYLSQTRNELLGYREEINKEIATITQKSTDLNTLSQKLKEEEKKINSQIEGSNLKLNFHKDQD
jgi:chromosome segregation ATPase